MPTHTLTQTLATHIHTRTLQVSAGSTFTYALDASGVVHSWGKNEAGQLGLGGGLSMDVYAMESMPQPVEALEQMGERVRQVAAGYNHGAALGETGKVYVWGGKSGFLEPSHVEDLGEDCVWIGEKRFLSFCFLGGEVPPTHCARSPFQVRGTTSPSASVSPGHSTP